MKQIVSISLTTVALLFFIPVKSTQDSLKELPEDLQHLISFYTLEHKTYADITKFAQRIIALGQTSNGSDLINNPQTIITLFNAMPYTANALTLATLLQQKPEALPVMKTSEIERWMSNAQSQLLGGKELIGAISNNDLESVENLLKNKNIDLNFILESENINWVPLMAAVTTAGIHYTQMLLNAGADPTIEKKYFWPPIMIAALWGRADIIPLLIAAGADPNYQCSLTPLTAVTGSFLPLGRERRIETIKVLVAYGADLNLKDRDGWTARDWAIHHYWPEALVTEVFVVRDGLCESSSP